ncbi:MAG: Phenylacetic acid catabolic protein [Rhodospirillaceae bacterium]
MAYTPGNPGTKLNTDFENDLLAIADTKLVLGNWYAECTMNGRSLPDFAAILGMCTANYGHTRAIYQYLAAHGHDYVQLERGRGPQDIRSMNLLDEAPTGWEDFIISTWLAELSTWMLASGFLKHEDRAVAGMAKKIGEETYFHLKYAHGWIQIIGEGKKQTELFQAAYEKRFPLALQWFGPQNGEDAVHAAGLRDVPLKSLREAFAQEAAKSVKLLGSPVKQAKSAKFVKDWRGDARRFGPMPDGLFEVVRFKDAEIAH